MIEAILANFAHYNISELFTLLATPSFYATIFMLIVLEATLSADNAVVLALLVKHLPEKERAKALKYGIVGAYAFRFVAIGLGTLLVKLWWVKLIGGGYLLYLALKYFYEMFFGKDEDHNDIKDGLQRSFWGTVAAVEAMDIAFSADSVLAAFGVSESVWVLLIGGMLGILAMRFAAGKFCELLEKVPELETAAYILIAIIGSKMLAAVGGYHMNEWAGFACMIGTFGGAFVVNYLKKK